MNANIFKKHLFFLAFIVQGLIAISQTVPMGVSYQAVARDNYGKELAGKEITVRFSILSGNPLGTLVYQELHSNIITSKYGVFSLVVGKGVPTGGTASELSGISWESANHYLKVEIKFENDYLDMGTMQFLAVPYALYAKKSLEPGPQGVQGNQGPKGDPGNPATDDQTLSFDESNLSISGGNSLPLTGLLQNLTVTNQTDGTYLGISRGNSVKLATIEADGDPKNEIQDITISSDKLKITNNALATEWDLTRYLDNTDNQALTYNAGTRELGIQNSATKIDLTELKNDADANPTNEIQDLSLTTNTLKITNNVSATGINLAPYLDNTDSQTLTYNASTNNLSISGGNNVSLGSMIAFRAKKTISELGLASGDYDFITPIIDYNDGSGFDGLTSVFTAPLSGIYTFIVGFYTGSSGTLKSLKLLLNGSLYETLNSDLSSSSYLTRSITMKLVAGDKVKVIVFSGYGALTESGTGSFSGYRVY